MILDNKDQFDYLLHEVTRDVSILLQTKRRKPLFVDDYVRQKLDEIKLNIARIEGDTF